jgi:hypothetical protein
VSRFAFPSDYDSPNGRPWTAARVLALGRRPGADFHIGPDVVIRMPVSLVHPGGFAFGVRQGGWARNATVRRTVPCGVPSRAYWYLPTFSLASSMRRFGPIGAFGSAVCYECDNVVPIQHKFRFKLCF